MVKSSNLRARRPVPFRPTAVARGKEKPPSCCQFIVPYTTGMALHRVGIVNREDRRCTRVSLSKWHHRKAVMYHHLLLVLRQALKRTTPSSPPRDNTYPPSPLPPARWCRALLFLAATAHPALYVTALPSSGFPLNTHSAQRCSSFSPLS